MNRIRFERPRIAAEFRKLVASLDKPDPMKPKPREIVPIDLEAPLEISEGLRSSLSSHAAQEGREHT